MKIYIKHVFVIGLSLFFLSGCISHHYAQTLAVGDKMINVKGESLDGKEYSIPKDFKGEKTLLLFGYVHKSQFDIDRWLIGLNMTKTDIKVYEIPTLKGFIPGLFSTKFDNAMREGIPMEIWNEVVTVYEDGDAIQRFTGNRQPKNARVMLLDENGIIIHFYDRGFSVDALNKVREKIN